MRKALLLICIAVLFTTTLMAGVYDYITEDWLRANPDRPANWFTDEELTRLDEIGRDFIPTDPPVGPVRQVAEFERMSGVLVRYNNGLAIPFSLVAEMSQDATVVTIVANTSQQSSAENAYTNAGVNLDNCVFMIAPTDREWTRDYGPWFIFDGDNELGVVNFIYNRPRPNDNDIPIAYGAFDTLNLFGMSVEHTGGNYMCDGLGQAASTTLVFSENSISDDQVRQYHEDFLGITNYHVLPDPLGDYIEHIDCWGKFLDVDKVLIARVPETDPRYDDFEYVADYFAETMSSWDTPFEVYRVDAPGTSPNTPYTNSLILNDKVFVPQTGHNLDDEALATYEEAMPGYQIIGVPYGGWLNTDALHCRTHEIPDKGMLYVHHMPAHDVEAGVDIPIEAYIFAHSGADLIADSLLARWRMSGETEWNDIVLTDDGDHMFGATLPAIAAGDTLEYYLHAADISGRGANHPFIGAPDPHIVAVAPDLEPPVITHTPPETVTTDDIPLEIVTEITDATGVETAYMYCWLNGDMTTYELVNTSGDEWTCTFDLDVAANGVVTYMFEANDSVGNQALLPADGVFCFTVEAVSVEPTPDEGFAFNVSPNPTRGEATVRFQLAGPQSVNVDVYNIRGQRVRTLASGELAGGQHLLRWDGCDSDGAQAASGLYFLRLQSATGTRVMKIMVLR